MLQNTENKLSIEALDRPAFWVKEGIVTEANTSAQQQCHINIGDNISLFLASYLEEYEQFKSGKLYLQIAGRNASVTAYADGHLFLLDSETSLPEQRILMQTSQYLRDPLSNSVSSTTSLLEMDSVKDNPDVYEHICSINRSLHQIWRTVNNMSDVALPTTIQNADRPLQNAKSVFDEIFEKAAQYVQATGRELHYKGLRQPLDCSLNADLLERAILNLISNAVKFSDAGSIIRVTLRQDGNKISLKITNECKQSFPKIHFNLFRNYLREPLIEDGRIGIGFGMTIVRNIALAHGGTLLLDVNKSHSIRVTMTIAVDTSEPLIIKSPIITLGGYNNGWDPYLIELSDILPNDVYKIF